MAPKLADGRSAPVVSAPGIIQINPAQLQPQTKSVAQLKLVIRRLPPGLTADEFGIIFGDEWRTGRGKVDWIEFRHGKIKSPGKHPEQSRAYIHFTNEAHIRPFEAIFLAATIHDAKGTWRNPDLKNLPPTLEFAPCQKVPTSKPRVDNRQGLIDQDTEYMAFLEGETQAAPRATALDSAPRTKETITSTPLIEALREKKAAKAKASAAKATKQNKDEPTPVEKVKPATTKGRKGAAAETKPQPKAEAKDKEAAKVVSQAIPDKPTPTPATTNAAAPAPNPARKRERPPVNIKNMLQRDLGLTVNPRRAAKDSAGQSSQPTVPTPSVPSGATAANLPSAPVPKGPKGARKASTLATAPTPGTATTVPKPSNKPPTGAAAVKATTKQTTPAAQATNAAPPSTKATNSTVKTAANISNADKTPTVPTTATNSRAARPALKPSAGATKAYLKHANASQGITDELLRAALSQFGELVSMEIDKRKGTALAEFKTPASLEAAMAKRNVTVGSGAVEVLEYKDRSAAVNKAPPSAPRGPPTRGGRGGRGGASGGPARSASNTASNAAGKVAAPSPAPG